MYTFCYSIFVHSAIEPHPVPYPLTNDMSSSQELLAKIHEIRNTVISIPDEFVKLKSDECDRLWPVQAEPSSKPLLSELTKCRN
jgi:hypothetical protein